MAEKKGVGHAYNVDFLNVVFAASSIFLFLSVIWIVWDDFDREWKKTQRQFANLEYQVTQAQRAQAVRAVDRSKIQQLEAQRKASEKQIEEMNAEQNRLGKRVSVLAPSAVKDYFRNAPLLDFMAPTIKVQQIILPNVVDDVNFIRVAKMDRCQTCHLAIDKKGYEKYPQPFTTHPDLATYLGGSSTHPIDKVGCTV